MYDRSDNEYRFMKSLFVDIERVAARHRIPIDGLSTGEGFGVRFVAHMDPARLRAESKLQYATADVIRWKLGLDSGHEVAALEASTADAHVRTAMLYNVLSDFNRQLQAARSWVTGSKFDFRYSPPVVFDEVERFLNDRRPFLVRPSLGEPQGESWMQRAMFGAPSFEANKAAEAEARSTGEAVRELFLDTIRVNSDSLWGTGRYAKKVVLPALDEIIRTTTEQLQELDRLGGEYAQTRTEIERVQHFDSIGADYAAAAEEVTAIWADAMARNASETVELDGELMSLSGFVTPDPRTMTSETLDEYIRYMVAGVNDSAEKGLSDGFDR